MLISKLKLFVGVFAGLALIAAATILVWPTLGAQDQGANRKSDQELLQGTWIPVSVVKRGQKEPVEDLKDAALTFDQAGKLVFTFGAEKIELTYKLNPAASPKEIDLTEADKGVHRGIYELKGDNLKICSATLLSIGQRSSPRPTARMSLFPCLRRSKK